MVGAVKGRRTSPWTQGHYAACGIEMYLSDRGVGLTSTSHPRACNLWSVVSLCLFISSLLLYTLL